MSITLNSHSFAAEYVISPLNRRRLLRLLDLVVDSIEYDVQKSTKYNLSNETGTHPLGYHYPFL